MFAFINVLAWVLFYRIQGLNSAVYALGFLFLIWSPFRRCDTGCSHYINQYRSNFWMTWHVKIYAKSFILEVNRAALFLLILVVTRHLIGWYSWRDVLYFITYLGMETHPLDNIFQELLFFLHVNLTSTLACMCIQERINRIWLSLSIFLCIIKLENKM